jgi:parvulin-like peptidyl-prolyl isomerase
MSELRKKVIKLAQEKPHLQPYLLPLVKKAAAVSDINKKFQEARAVGDNLARQATAQLARQFPEINNTFEFETFGLPNDKGTGLPLAAVFFIRGNESHRIRKREAQKVVKQLNQVIKALGWESDGGVVWAGFGGVDDYRVRVKL